MAKTEAYLLTLLFGEKPEYSEKWRPGETCLRADSGNQIRVILVRGQCVNSFVSRTVSLFCVL